MIETKRPRPYLNRLVSEIEESRRHAMVLGACVGLGWNGEGQPPKSIRREAERRLEKIGGRAGK